MSKLECGSQSVDVARWVRPALEQAQDVLSGGLGQEWSISSCSFFVGSFFVFDLLSLFYYCFFFVFVLVSCSQKSNRLVWVCLSTFLGFTHLLLDLKVVFKRIIYPVLSWF